MKNLYSIGVDIGGTNTDIGLINGNGTVITRENLKTSLYSDPNIYVEDLVRIIKKMIENIDYKKVTGIGIGAPAANYYTGSIENATNLNFKGVVPLRDLMQALLPFPVVVSNDANAATYGEMIYGGAKGMKHFLMFTFRNGYWKWNRY